MSGDKSELNEVDSLAPGDLVDHFKVLRQLGRGGMGAVYLARDTKLGRKVVLKLVLPEVLSASGDAERFLFEARATAKFSHPHIVTIYAVGEHSGAPYLALEYLEGQNLRERISQHQFGVLEVVRVGLAISEALAEAHAHDLIHRDLKPENVILPKDGRLRVLDFGLAKPLPKDDLAITKKATTSSAPGQSTTLAREFETEAGLVGTPLYMAPEQWLQRPVTAKTDLWALGVMLYELLTGKRPFEAPTAGDLRGLVCSEDAPSIDADGVPGELRELVAACLDRDPEERPTAVDAVGTLKTLLRPEQGRAEEGRPFRGLLPFTEDHAGFFFGRDTEVEAFVERLAETPVLPVVGPSGAGKSSFVGAGVIPRLKERDRWIVVRSRPGRSPFMTLSSALERGETTSAREGARLSQKSIVLADMLEEHPGLLSMRLLELAEAEDARVLLFVDQLEELYTQVESQDARRGFMEAICTAADDPGGPVRVVFTLRDDFLGRVAETAAARTVLGQIKVLRSPDEAALRQILTEPLERTDYTYDDPELPDRMIAAVAGEAASLPLLQFTCSRLWDQRDRERKALTLAAYEAMGGVEGALAHHADEVFEGLTPEQERVARRLLLRLITAEGTRKAASRKEILQGQGDDGAAVLDRLAQGRMITVRRGRGDDAELELAHESLIARWSRLRRWVDESREGLTFLAETGQAAELWDRRGRRDDELWGGEALHDAQRLLDLYDKETTELVREFVAAGHQREARSAGRRRWLVIAAITVLAIVAAGALIAAAEISDQRDEVERQRGEVEQQRERSEQRHAEAQYQAAVAALRQGDTLQARIRARMALESQDITEARALWAKLQREPLRWKTTLESVQGMDFSSDGKTIVGGGYDGVVSLIDAATGRVIRSWQGHTDRIPMARFSPNEELIATGSGDKTIKLWTLDGTLKATLRGHEHRVTSLSFDGEGRRLASVSHDKTLRLWDVGSGELIHRMEGHEGALYDVHFVRDDEIIVTGASDATVRLWSSKTGSSLAVLEGHEGPVFGIDVSPDGKTVASASWDGSVRLWDLEKREHVETLRGPGFPVYEVIWSKDGRQVIAGYEDGTIGFWRRATGEVTKEIKAFKTAAWRFALSDDGRKLAASTFPWQGFGVWDLGAVPGAAEATMHEGMVTSIDMSPDGRTVVSGGLGDHTVRLWNVETGRLKQVLRSEGGPVNDVQLSPDVRHLASAGQEIAIWNLERGRIAQTVPGPRSPAYIDFSPDGQLLAVGAADGKVWLWDTGRQESVATLTGHKNYVFALDFSPDGKVLATGSVDGTIRIWDVRARAQLGVLEGHESSVKAVAFDREGSRLASNGMDGTVRLWDWREGTNRIIYRTDGVSMGNGLVFNQETGEILATIDRAQPAVGIDLESGGVRHFPGMRYFFASSRDETRIATAFGLGINVFESKSGRSLWWSAFVDTTPPILLSHRGGGAITSSGLDEAKLPSTSWREAIEERSLLVSSDAESGVLCLSTTEGRLELWDMAEDRIIDSSQVSVLWDVVAGPGGCLASQVHPAKARLFTRNGQWRELLPDLVTAVARDGEEILAARGNTIHRFGADGVNASSHASSFDGWKISAMVRWNDTIIGANELGGLEMIHLGPSPAGEPISFEDVVESPAMRMVLGPRDTLAVGFSTGEVGLWDLRTGVRIDLHRLDGWVWDLVFEGNILYAATDWGRHLRWDLSALEQDRCELLREVRQDVPYIWEKGRPVERSTASSGPACKRR